EDRSPSPAARRRHARAALRRHRHREHPQRPESRRPEGGGQPAPHRYRRPCPGRAGRLDAPDRARHPPRHHGGHGMGELHLSAAGDAARPRQQRGAAHPL
ncbi:MAG: hypothetical protein AVDCRST_MAG89-2443, partial [uncultured Gemmatimonadetes bacterium]